LPTPTSVHSLHRLLVGCTYKVKKEQQKNRCSKLPAVSTRVAKRFSLSSLKQKDKCD